MADLLDVRQDSTAASPSSLAPASSAPPSQSASAAASASASTRPSETGSSATDATISGTRASSAFEASVAKTGATTDATAGATDTPAAGFTFIETAPPSYTATISSAWHAEGINATVNSTYIYTGTNTASTASSLPAGAVITGTGNSTIADYKEDFIACRINGSIPDQSPFCTPENRQELWVGKVYAATWNSDLFETTASNYIEIHNANSTSSDNSKIYTTEEVHNLKGYINIHMLKEHLLGHAGNDTDSAANLTFHLISIPHNGKPNITIGPIISLTYDPDSLPKIRIPPAIPKKLGFQIGLPIGLVAFIVIALSICCAIRKNKQKWRDIRHHGSDYVKKRTRKRRAARGQSIELNDYDFDSSTARAERFEDEPTRGGNAFRDEIERQKQEEWRNRPQKITSF